MRDTVLLMYNPGLTMTTPLPGKEDIDVTGVPISQDFVKWVLAAKASSGKFCVFTQFSYNL